ncbi:MAG: CsbD family protein [Propionivibrio sp.]|uniref:CsbD family protein n=1 Tax=Candidatus Propionivibrio dominans TaxID=2954373 RepID=A0A9D7FDV0_9RHOO|nr:CsbD family protein [Candidatus Propionivibrio dominans]
MNKDQTTGRINEAKGKVKEVVGDLVGNKELEIKGKVQNTRGKAQATYGDAKEDIKDALKGK